MDRIHEWCINVFSIQYFGNDDCIYKMKKVNILILPGTAYPTVYLVNESLLKDTWEFCTLLGMHVTLGA